MTGGSERSQRACSMKYDGYKDKKQELEKKIQYEKEKLQESEGKFNTLNKLEDKEDLIFKAIDNKAEVTLSPELKSISISFKSGVFV